ncbi:MAG: hypothetical protein ACREEB_04180 [Caulobacteraceae bacterium]
MRSRAILILTVAGAGLALAGCYRPFFRHHHPYRTVTTLDCPASQGDLTRKDQAADGKTCDYVGPNGEAVTLQLVALNGTDANAALAPLEAKLRAEAPAAATSAPAGNGEGRVDIDLPGIHIHASGKDNDQNGSSSVRIGRDTSAAGNTVVASNGSGAVDIEAHDKGAEIRVDEGRGGVRRDFILASDTPGPNGYKVAAYSARGPKGGPLVVASMLAKSDDHDRLSDDIHELLRDNVGGGGW